MSVLPVPGTSAPITLLVTCSSELLTVISDPCMGIPSWNVRHGTGFRAAQPFFRSSPPPEQNSSQKRPSSRNKTGAGSLTLNSHFLEDKMTTSSSHTSAILASRVKGTAVYNGSGD